MTERPFKSGYVVAILLFLIVSLIIGLTYYVLKDNGIDLLGGTTNEDTQTSKKLSDYEEKELVGENAAYSVYVYDITDGSVEEGSVTGKMLVYDRYLNKVYEIKDVSTFDGSAIVTNDNGHYVMLSKGTAASQRSMSVVSLASEKIVLDNKCLGGEASFWKDSVIFENCDSFSSRPWEGGIASSLEIVNLSTGVSKVLAKSGEWNQYSIVSIEGSTLNYEEDSVEDIADWEKTDTSWLVSTKTYNLE